MEVTVVVTTVGGPWLTGQLAALAGQIKRAEQLVLVNNGRPGAVDTVVDEWRDVLPELELVEDQTMAVCGHARNVGASRARHEAVLFVDDDDEVAPGYVAAMSKALAEADLVAARIDLERLNPPALARRWGAMQADGPMTYHGFLPWVIGGASGIRRVLFERLGGFDTTLLVAEDTDLSWRAQLEADATIGFAPDAVLSYRLRNRPRPAFRQARLWAQWEVALYRRFEPMGLPAPGNQVRALLRWGRPLLLLLRSRRGEDLVVAAREFGGCIGRLEGSIRHRHLHL